MLSSQNTNTDENFIKEFDPDILRQNLTDEKTQLLLSPIFEINSFHCQVAAAFPVQNFG